MIAFFIYLITPSLLLSSLFSIILYSNLHLFKSYKYMFAIYRASFMIIIIYFYLFAYVKYLLSLIMIIMLLLYLMIVNLFIIRSRFDIVVIMSLLLYHFSNYILIIKIDNLFYHIFHVGFSSLIYHYHFCELIYFIYDKFLFIDHGTLISENKPVSLLY